MKKIFAILIVILIANFSFAQQPNVSAEKTRYLKTVTEASTVIFEGKVLKKNKSFWGTGENVNDIYTSYTIQVDNILFGNITPGTIEIVIYGGQMEKDGIGTAIENAHGTGLCSGSAVFFCKPFTKGTSGIINSNIGDFDLISNYCDNELMSANAGNNSYSSKKELYDDVSKFKSISIPQEKKSPNANEIKKENEKVANTIDYDQNVKNYDANLALLLNKIEQIKSKKNNSTLSNDITFSFTNPATTGTNPRYFEFDITAQANNNTTYFDGSLFRISYNTTAFGSDVVKNNKVTITRGSTFNSGVATFVWTLS